MNTLFGRTNREFPEVWLSLRPPEAPDHFIELAKAASATSLPLDVTRAVSLWGAHLSESCGPIVAFLTDDFTNARSRDDACDQVSAQIVQILSSLLGRRLTFAFLPVKRVVEEAQWDGALAALELARQDGLVEYVGLSSHGPPLATLSAWQFRDAFEVLCVHDQESLAVLGPLAAERRVGVLSTFECRETRLVPVQSVTQVRQVQLVRNVMQTQETIP